ncbi:MAG: PH domain-containing protein [Nakamurella sp.]
MPAATDGAAQVNGTAQESGTAQVSGTAGPATLVIRPRKIAIFGAISAIAVLATMIVLGLLLQADGIPMRAVDKIGFMSVGLFGAATIMLVARPKITAGVSGMSVRNVLGDTVLPWPVVHKIAFPPGSHWALAILADDETLPLMAIQAMDKGRAVDALKALRALHETYAPKAPQRSPEAIERDRRRQVAEAAAAAARPLGRLEQIDRDMAAKGPKPKRRARNSS